MTYLTLFFLAFGTVMLFTAALGVHRFPNALSRLHAAGKVGGMAISFLLFAMLSMDFSIGLAIKVLLIVVLTHFTAAQAAQIIARSTGFHSPQPPTNSEEN